MSEELKPADILVLQRLVMKESRLRGHDIQKAFEETGEEPPSLASIYISLRELEKRGLVRRLVGDQDDPHTPTPIPYYVVTEWGKAAFEKFKAALRDETSG